MNQMTIKELVKLMDTIDLKVQRMRRPKGLDGDISRGLGVSKLATGQPIEVPISPLFKNMLSKHDNYGDNDRLMVNDPKTKAEIFVEEYCIRELNRFNGKEIHKYSEDEPILSKKHYDVDCWRNLKENMRDIQPGQMKERSRATKVFASKPKRLPIKQLLLEDVVFQKMIGIILESIPSVKASQEFKEINLPFMSKHTNVSYPYWYNDRAKVGKTNKTYAQLTMDEAKALPLSKIQEYNVSTAYGRNQRGKGRLLIAISRIANLILNQLEAEEIKAYKEKSPLFAGYNDDKKLKSVLKYIGDACIANNLKCANWDQRYYDQHVSYDWILLLGAISIYKSIGSRSKAIALERSVLACKTWLVDGMTGKVYAIYGRIFSGFIDTNRGGGLINAMAMLYCCMKQDPNYSHWTYVLHWWMLVMGDDNLFVYSKLDKERLVKDMASIGFQVHPDKGEYGVFFLQNRLIKIKGKYVMTYPWTRVVRSLLFKETGKGLGPYGWTVAFWQQCYKLVEFPEALQIVLKLIVPYDKMGLCLNVPIAQLKQGIKKEDQEASKSKKRSKTTAETLFDGDPTKQAQFVVQADGKVEFNSSYLKRVQSALRKAYNLSMKGEN